jgi:hypothetical protein
VTEKKKMDSNALFESRCSETMQFRVLADPEDVRLPSLIGDTFSVWPWGEVYWKLDTTGAFIHKSDINKLLEKEKIARLVRRNGALVEMTGKATKL